jgi:hypothetical protein
MDFILSTGTATILNDNLFQFYGGDFGKSSTLQREMSYRIAEQRAIEYLNTPLTPTIVTGTASWPIKTRRLQLRYNRVHEIVGVTALYEYDYCCEEVVINGCAWLVDGPAGIIDISVCGNHAASACSGCGSFANSPMNGYHPKTARIAYKAGLPDGQLAGSPQALLGLVTLADLALEQIADPSQADGGPGDVSIRNFSDAGYSENRQFLKMTKFGGSPRANYAEQLLRVFKYKRVLGWKK